MGISVITLPTTLNSLWFPLTNYNCLSFISAPDRIGFGDKIIKRFIRTISSRKKSRNRQASVIILTLTERQSSNLAPTVGRGIERRVYLTGKPDRRAATKGSRKIVRIGKWQHTGGR